MSKKNGKPITDKHWLPENRSEWYHAGDLRTRVLDAIADRSDGPIGINPAVETDPVKPEPVKILSVNWIHADIHGILTRETWRGELARAIPEFAALLIHWHPFTPVRLYKEARAAYGIGFFDFKGPQHPFDIRAIVQFGQWDFPGGQRSAGFKFSLATLVLPKPGDEDLYVGQDWGKIFDDED